jgi:RimJ/RimL family protein N-acetyltransferase
MTEEGGRRFHLFREGEFLGDADFRALEPTRAEFAIIVGSRAAQGKGLGRRFATMLHAFAFHTLGLERVYVTLLPANQPSRKMFEKLGYRLDESPQARSYVDEESDLALSAGRTEFEAAQTAALPEIRIRER